MIEPYIATYSGGSAYPFGLNPDDISVEDIAHSLSMQCRYAGHTSEFWSVAAHSLEVSRRVEDAVRETSADGAVVFEAALAGLLHDASEAYLVDLPKPIKPLFVNYAQWEEAAELAVATRFGMQFPWPAIVTRMDKAIVRDEVANFFCVGSVAWKRHGVTQPAHNLVPLDPVVGERLFLERFYLLMNTVTSWRLLK